MYRGAQRPRFPERSAQVGRGGWGSGSGQPQATNTRIAFDDDESGVREAGAQRVMAAATATPTAAPPAAQSAHHKVQTVINDSGTELPQRLNNKVFVDGLPFQYLPAPGKPSLEDEMAQFVREWKVGILMKLIKKDGQGFGYVAFRSPNSVDVAVRVLNGRKFLGRFLRVEVPKPKCGDGEGKGNAAIRDQGKDSYARQVLLSDLAKVSQPDVIREILREVAPQMEQQIETIKMTSNNRKAFLTLKSESDVAAAVRFLNGFSLLGRTICAQPAMAPGSLPYSHAASTAKPSKPISFGEETVESRKNGPNARTVFDEENRLGGAARDDSSALVVPLGMSPLAAPEGKTAEKKGKVAAAAVSAPSATSNRTQQSLAEEKPQKLRRLESTATATQSLAAAQGKTSKYDLLDKGSKDIYVGNLPDDVSAEQVTSHFAGCGRITKCTLVVNPSTQAPTGIAHVEFAIPAYAKYALDNLHGSRLRGSAIRVDRGEEANPAVLASASILSLNDGDEVDEDAYLKHHGIRNKDAYFRGTSVVENCAAPASASEAKGKKSKARSTEPRERRATKGVSRGADIAEEDDGDDLPFAVGDDDDEEEAFFDVDDAPVVGASRKSSIASKKKPQSTKSSQKKRPRN